MSALFQFSFQKEQVKEPYEPTLQKNRIGIHSVPIRKSSWISFVENRLKMNFQSECIRVRIENFWNISKIIRLSEFKFIRIESDYFLSDFHWKLCLVWFTLAQIYSFWNDSGWFTINSKCQEKYRYKSKTFLAKEQQPLLAICLKIETFAENIATWNPRNFLKNMNNQIHD